MLGPETHTGSWNLLLVGPKGLECEPEIHNRFCKVRRDALGFAKESGESSMPGPVQS